MHVSFTYLLIYLHKKRNTWKQNLLRMMAALNAHFSGCGAALLYSQSSAGKCCNTLYIQSIYGQFRLQAVHHRVRQFSNCLVQADPSCCSVWRRTPQTFDSSVQANMGWLFHTQMTDFVRRITLRVMHSSQEAVLTAAEPIKDTNRKREPTWFIFHGITWWACSKAGGERERGGGLLTTICTVYLMCVSGSNVQCVSSGLHVFLCTGEKRRLADSDADQRNRAGGMKSDRNFQGNDG